MTDITNIQLVFMVVASLVPALFMILTSFINKLKNNHRKEMYDHEKKMIEMEVSRMHYEKKLYDLTEKLSMSESRYNDVNHLLFKSPLNSDNYSEKKYSAVNKNNFIKSMGLNDDDLVVDNKLIFMMTPFNPIFNDDFHAVRDVCSRVGFKCIRGDEENITGNILPHIIKKILKARLVIANINGRNPNVFYELGIAHALNKPTIIISKSESSIPFDIKSHRIVFYKNNEQLDSNLIDSILKIVS